MKERQKPAGEEKSSTKKTNEEIKEKPLDKRTQSLLKKTSKSRPSKSNHSSSSRQKHSFKSSRSSRRRDRSKHTDKRSNSSKHKPKKRRRSSPSSESSFSSDLSDSSDSDSSSSDSDRKRKRGKRREKSRLNKKRRRDRSSISESSEKEKRKSKKSNGSAEKNKSTTSSSKKSGEPIKTETLDKSKNKPEISPCIIIKPDLSIKSDSLSDIAPDQASVSNDPFEEFRRAELKIKELLDLKKYDLKQSSAPPLKAEMKAEVKTDKPTSSSMNEGFVSSNVVVHKPEIKVRSFSELAAAENPIDPSTRNIFDVGETFEEMIRRHETGWKDVVPGLGSNQENSMVSFNKKHVGSDKRRVDLTQT